MKTMRLNKVGEPYFHSFSSNWLIDSEWDLIWQLFSSIFLDEEIDEEGADWQEEEEEEEEESSVEDDSDIICEGIFVKQPIPFAKRRADSNFQDNESNG